MWNRKELKERGKAAFTANYWRCVLAALILTFITGSATYISSSGRGHQSSSELPQQMSNLPPWAIAAIAGVSIIVILIFILVKIFIFNPLEVGCHKFFIDNCSIPTTSLSTIKKGFENFGKVFVTLFLRDLFLVLWTLLFIVPGLIKAYSYRMVPYILAEEPDLEPMEVINRSKEMMNGNKWAAFVLDLSFIGWFLLSLVTCGLVDVLWTSPYKKSTDAELYLALRQQTIY